MMRTIALVLLIVAAVAADKNEIKEIVASVKLFNANNSHLLGAINFWQTGPKLQSFVALGHLWGVEPGKYIGVVHKRGESEAEGLCSGLGPVVKRADKHLRAHRPITIFLKKLNGATDYRFISVDEGASLSPDSKHNIMNHTVVIYRVLPADLGLCFVSRESIATPIACGVVVPGPVQPGDVIIPDFIEDDSFDDDDDWLDNELTEATSVVESSNFSSTTIIPNDLNDTDRVV